MEFVALVTLLLVFQYLTFMMLCGMARARGDVQAPAVSGDEMFERAYRVQMNTVEQLLICLPAMWVCAHYFSPLWAAGFGAMFLVGRALYAAQYMRDPTTRTSGMMIGFFGNIANVGCGLWGVVGGLIS